MNVKKAIKKIAAVGAGALLVSSAFAASLSEWPQPFVTEDGVQDSLIVLSGSSANPNDYLGAIDIAIALQAAAVSETSVDVGGKTETVVEGGVAVSSSGNKLLLGENLYSAKPETLDDNDFPALLADGEVVEEDEDEDFKYQQTLVLGSSSVVEFNTGDKDIDDPELYVALDGSAWTYTMAMKSGNELDLTALGDSETIEMLGKSFTFDAQNTETGEIILFGSDVTTALDLNVPVTVDVDGESYTVEIIGGNEANDYITIDVDGDRENVKQGKSYKIGGLDIFAKNVFIDDFGTTTTAYGDVFIGSEEITLPAANAGAATVQVNSDDMNGLKATVVGTTNNTDLTSITFEYTPKTLDADDGFGMDETRTIKVGETLKDPLFGTLGLTFDGASSAMDSSAKSYVNVAAGDDELAITFTNNDGDEVTFSPIELTGSNTAGLAYATDSDGYNGAFNDTTDIVDEQVFILNEGTSEKTTYIFEVVGWAISDNEVKLKNIVTDETEAYANGATLITGTTIDAVNATAQTMSLSANSSNRLYLEGGKNYLTIVDNDTITLTENDTDETATTVATYTVDYDSTDTELDVSAAFVGSYDGSNDDGNDFKYTITQYGTYFVGEIDEKTGVEAWVPKSDDAEVEYTVILASEGAKVMTTGGSSMVKTQTVNPFAVGAAVKDVDVNPADPAKNLIVVGGACINSVSAYLKDLEAGSCGDASGLSPNEAMVEVIDLDNGKVAMLVAGYEGVDTLAAARAVASGEIKAYDKAAVKLTVTSASNYKIE